MINSFQEHHTTEELQVLQLKSEALDWEERLEVINDEIAFFSELLVSGFDDKVKVEINRENLRYLTGKFDEVKQYNDFHLETIKDYKNKLEGLKECDDVQCENYFLKDHLLFKQSLNRHFKSLRELKRLSFKYLKTSFS